MTLYPPKLGAARNSAWFQGIERRVRQLETRTSSIDSGFPLAALPGVVSGTYSSGDPEVYVNGSAALSGPFRYLTGYAPAAGDQVLLIPVGATRTYVVLGKLSA